MRYNDKQVEHTAKLIVRALYGEITIEEAKSKMLPELEGADIHKNFIKNVDRTRDRLSGETPHFSVPLKWAKEIYPNLKTEDKGKYLEAIQRQIEEDSKHNKPSIKLQVWLNQETILCKDRF